jgi:hypothetical protein
LFCYVITTAGRRGRRGRARIFGDFSNPSGSLYWLAGLDQRRTIKESSIDSSRDILGCAVD